MNSNYRTLNMNPNMNAGMRSMRGAYPAGGPMQRSQQNNCGCGENPVPQNNYSHMANPAAQNDCGCSGQVPRTAQNDCGCGQTIAGPQITDMPTGDRASLLAYIDQVSFAACEAELYLDTHPDCRQGMQYFLEHSAKRNAALQEYAKLYGPLTLQYAGENCDACWQWISQPWPWEGGNC